jgi:hypothetical protein
MVARGPALTKPALTKPALTKPALTKPALPILAGTDETGTAEAGTAGSRGHVLVVVDNRGATQAAGPVLFSPLSCSRDLPESPSGAGHGDGTASGGEPADRA